MAKYGNSGGKNKGKKYTKLTGLEVPTIPNERRARNFMAWYGAHFAELKTALYFKGRVFDDQIATDTALLIYDAIALKGYRIASYADYFFRAYHTNSMKSQVNDVKEAQEVYTLDGRQRGLANHAGVDGALKLIDILPAPEFNYALYEEVVDALNTEVLDYVRANYSDFDTCIFEIYLGLLPDTSYKKLSALLDIPITKIWTAIGAIKKDVQIRFKDRKEYLLSLL